jgi:flavin-dependent thymidylate synthase
VSELPVKWGDDAQYFSRPARNIVPTAYLLWATPDPLGAIAAVGKMFKGEPVYTLDEITDVERRLYWEESFKSHLRAPHEFVQFHFMVEGVSRAHTHQMVRQRTATFAQESLRFAVKEGLAREIPLPPSIMADSDPAVIWVNTIDAIETAYLQLVNAGIPAEDARGLLPHATTTRLHWRTNLADLIHHAGNRLCTQAQFEWRRLMISVMSTINRYNDHGHNGWQFQEIARPTHQTWSPICFHTGKCEFKAIFDRPCIIRDRVEAMGAAGIPSSQWTGLPEDGQIAIDEWLLFSDAAR